MKAMRLEPAAFISGLEAAVNAVQVAAVPLPTWAHTAIAGVSIILGGIAIRQQVIPTAKIAPPEQVLPDAPHP